MKVTNSLIALSLLVAPLTATAYQKAENIEQGKNLVTDDGYAIVTYADGWDKYSKKTAEMMMADPAVTKALGNAVVMTLPVPNVTSKEEHEANKTRFGNMDLSFPNVYPAIILYDKTGRRLTDICIPYSERKNPAAIATKVSTAMTAARKQAKLLSDAEKAQGVEKARLLGQASTIPGINRPNKVADMIKKVDPKDESGMQRIASLNLFATAIESAKTKDWEADLATMKELMENPLLTTEQKQQACCISIGLLRRHGGLARKAELKQMIAKLRSLDPDSLLGKSATDAERMWITTFNIFEGWSPDILPSDDTPVELEGPLPISAAGTYEVSFTYKKGRHALCVLAVELYDGNKKVTEDRHKGLMGLKTSGNVYTLNIPTAVKKPRILVTFDMRNNRDSYGKVTITRK